MSKKILMFTDGACSGNPGPGGWATVLQSPLGKVREMGGAEPATTNNRMELVATLEGLRALAKVKSLSTKEIQLYTDSKYVIQGITEWIHGWKKRGWVNSEGKDVSHRDLWEALESLIQQEKFQVEWLYVPGHSGYPGNERCDAIAVAFSKGEAPNLFVGDKKDYRYNLEDVPSSQIPSKKLPSPIYLSLINGKVHRDSDWKSCEARVKGQGGAKFKKVNTVEEEAAVLKAWGKA